jgi:hypothetical protein
MRKLVLAPVLLLALVASAPASARADATENAAIRADSSSFELFGTRFCYGPAEGCDVTLATPEPEPLVVAQRDHVTRVELFGLTLCSELPETGPACDVAWWAPEAAARWRDMPEVRLLAAIDRYR